MSVQELNKTVISTRRGRRGGWITVFEDGTTEVSLTPMEPPLRTPMWDVDGSLTRPWATYFTWLAGSISTLSGAGGGGGTEPPEPTPAVLTAVSASEVPSRYATPDTRSEHLYVGIVPTLTGDVPCDVTYWISDDNGATYVWIGWQPVHSLTGQVIKVDRIVPEVNQTWRAAAIAGAYGGNPTPIAAVALPAGAIASASFAVNAIEVPPATGVTNASVLDVEGTTEQIVTRTREDLSKYGEMGLVQYTDPIDLPQAFFVRVTVQEFDFENNPLDGPDGVERPFAGYQVEGDGGKVRQTGTLPIVYKPGLTSIRIKIYLANRISQSTWDFSDTATNTLQSCWAAVSPSTPTFLSLPVPMVGVTSVTGAEAGDRYAQLDNRLAHLFVDITPTLEPESFPVDVAYWVSSDDGATWVWIGWEAIREVGQAIRVDRLVPVEDQTWRVAAAAGKIGGNPIPIPDSELPAGAARSAGFAVPMYQPPADSLTAADIAVPAPGPLPNPYNVSTPYRQYFQIDWVKVNDLLALSDPYAFIVRVTAQDLDVDLNPIFPENPHSSAVVVGQEHTLGPPIAGEYGVAERTGIIHWVRLKVYVCSRLDQTTRAFENPLAATLQTACTTDVLIGAPPPVTPPGIDDAPPVTIGETIDEVLYEQKVEELPDGQFEISVWWTPDASADETNFKGVAVYLEDPDVSETPATPMDDTTVMDGTRQMAGKWAPVQVTTTTASPANFKVPGMPADRKIRVYLDAYNDIVNATVVRANESGPTPNIQIDVPSQRTSGQKGMEFAWHVTDPSVEVVTNFENPANPTYSLKFHFTEPDDTIPLPPGMRPFGGVQTVYQYPSQGNRLATARFLHARQPNTWISDEYYATTITFLVYFCSAADVNRVNTVERGVTPMVEVSVVYQPHTPPVSNFTLTNPRHAWQPDGTILALANLNWVTPASARYAEVRFYLTATIPARVPPIEPRLLGVGGNRVSNYILQVVDWPKTAEAWTIAAIGVDDKGRESDDPKDLDVTTPTVVWNIGPPGLGGTGQEYTDLVTGTFVVTHEQQLNSDGVVMMRHKISGWNNSTANSFGGVSIARLVSGSSPATDPVTWWNAPKNVTTLVTDWEPAFTPVGGSFDFYFVSRDQQDRRNSILPGITPKVTVVFTPMEGHVIPSRFPGDWWNEDEFVWPEGDAGKFTALSFVAKKIFVGSILRVGGGTTAGVTDPSFGGPTNGQIAVYNNVNELRAWMGQQSTGTPDSPGAHAVYGGWFKELYVGGDNPTNAPIYAKSDGVVIVGGFDTAGTRYPRISIRDETGVEKGRIGAKVGEGLSEAPNIAGAWFQEFACGGQSLADWRMLARRNPTNPSGGDLFNLRNINKFQIDYPANYAADPHPNAACTMLFGSDAYVADNNIASTYKFPGLSIRRTTAGSAGHEAVLINRGLVLNMPSGTPPYNPVKAGAFVTYNGNTVGADTLPFWCSLTMYSPTTQAINIEMASGSDGSGNPYIWMKNTSNQKTFEVTASGALTAWHYGVWQNGVFYNGAAQGVEQTFIAKHPSGNGADVLIRVRGGIVTATS